MDEDGDALMSHKKVHATSKGKATFEESKNDMGLSKQPCESK